MTSKATVRSSPLQCPFQTAQKNSEPQTDLSSNERSKQLIIKKECSCGKCRSSDCLLVVQKIVLFNYFVFYELYAFSVMVLHTWCEHERIHLLCNAIYKTVNTLVFIRAEFLNSSGEIMAQMKHFSHINYETVIPPPAPFRCSPFAHPYVKLLLYGI